MYFREIIRRANYLTIIIRLKQTSLAQVNYVLIISSVSDNTAIYYIGNIYYIYNTQTLHYDRHPNYNADVLRDTDMRLTCQVYGGC